MSQSPRLEVSKLGGGGREGGIGVIGKDLIDLNAGEGGRGGGGGECNIRQNLKFLAEFLQCAFSDILHL